MTISCPKCGFAYAWDGLACGHCHYPGQAAPPQDLFIEELARWGPWFLFPGLVVAAFCGGHCATGWWESVREMATSWGVLLGGAIALVLAVLAHLPGSGPWRARILRLFVTMALYAIAWTIGYLFFWYITRGLGTWA
jgi:hypothetical protein